MRFELFIAARYLRARRRQAVVGLITAISVIGVAAGVASLIIALAITNGMRRDLHEMLDVAARHNVKAITESFKMKDANEAVKRVKNNKVRYRAVLAN